MAQSPIDDATALPFRSMNAEHVLSPPHRRRVMRAALAGFSRAEETMAELRTKARRAGYKCGAAWAKKIATHEAMRRLRRINERTLKKWAEADGAKRIDGARRAIFQVIHGATKVGKSDPRDERNLLSEFFISLAGIEHHENGSFYVGFVEGAIQQSGHAAEKG